MTRTLKICGLLALLAVLIVSSSANTISKPSTGEIKTYGWSWLIYHDFSVNELYPGVMAYCDIWLENTGDQELYIYEIHIQWDWMGSQAYYTSVDVYLKPGEFKYLGRVAFSIPESIIPGFHSYRVGVAQKHKSWFGWIDDGWIWMKGWREVEILTPPKIKIVSSTFDAAKIKTGQTVNLVIQIQNKGEATALDVKIKVTVPSGLTLVDFDNQKTISSISGGTTKTIKFSFKAKKSGTYIVSITVNSKNAGSDASQAQIEVEATVTESIGDTIFSNDLGTEIPIIATIGILSAVLVLVIKKTKPKY